MNKTQLAAAIAEDTECSKSEAIEFLDSFERLVRQNVKAGEAVMLSGFVKFERKSRAARKGRNPATGEAIQIAAKTVVKVTPLKKFKDAVMEAAPKGKNKR